jgi:hypothetical protein
VTRRTSDYVALAMVSRIKWKQESFPFDDKITDHFERLFREAPSFTGDMEELKSFAEERCNFSVTEALLAEALRSLAECGLVRVTDDNYSGTFVKLKPSEFESFVKRANSEVENAKKYNEYAAILTRPSDYPNAAAMMTHEIFEDYNELGDEWLMRALIGLKARHDVDGSLPLDAGAMPVFAIEGIPASDRVVTLSDNQQVDLETSTTELIEIVEKQNGVDGDQSLKQQIVGQLKAGRELVRAGVFKLALIEQTVLSVLGGLVEKYKDQAIGQAAKKLLDLLIEYVLGR